MDKIVGKYALRLTFLHVFAGLYFLREEEHSLPLTLPALGRGNTPNISPHSAFFRRSTYSPLAN